MLRLVFLVCFACCCSVPSQQDETQRDIDSCYCEESDRQAAFDRYMREHAEEDRFVRWYREGW